MIERPATVHCGVMEASYLSWSEGSEATAPSDDRIRILVPGERGAFEAAFRTQDGRRHSIVVHEPFVGVIPAFQDFSLSCQRPSDLVTLSLDNAFIVERARKRSAREPQLDTQCEKIDPFLRGIGNTLRCGFRVARPPTESYLDSLAAAIADHLLSAYDRPSTGPSSGLAPHRLQRVCKLVEERLGDGLHVSDMADCVNLSVFHFMRMFRDSTGQSPHAYLTMKRMERAKALLAEGKLPLAQVASVVGYQTQAHFTGVFHCHVGMTPRAYRVRARGSNAP